MKFLKVYFLSVLFIAATSSLTAQEFPATQKEAVSWLTASEWKLKSLIIDDRLLNAEQINMKATIRFFTDSSYSMAFMSENRQGIYQVSMEEKWILLLNKEPSNEIIIRSLKKDELEAISLGEGESGPKMVFVPVKK